MLDHAPARTCQNVEGEKIFKDPESKFKGKKRKKVL